MRLPRVLFCLIHSLTLVVPTTLLAGGADVDETSFDKELYVDVDAPGPGDGSEADPWTTITEALAWVNAPANSSKDVKVHIANGTYREPRLDIEDRSGVTVVEGESEGGVIISGSDIWTGWSQDLDSGMWYKDWLYDWGETDIVESPLLSVGPRAELVFQNGVLLRQVGSLAELVEGTYFVDDGLDATIPTNTDDRIYVYPRGGMVPDHPDVTLEVGVRRRLFGMHRNDDVVLRKLLFQHAPNGGSTQPGAPIMDPYAFFIGGLTNQTLENPDYPDLSDQQYLQQMNIPANRDFCENILIDRCIFQWNNFWGASINNIKFLTIKDSQFRYNGGGGVSVTRIRDSEYVDTQFKYNNWRYGVYGDEFGYSPAGTKTLFADRLSIRGCDFIGNQAPGLWMDFASTNFDVEDTLIMHNWSQGFFNEANYGPMSASQLLVRNNGWWPKGRGSLGGGIYFAESRAFTVTHSYIIDNAYYGLAFQNRPREAYAYWSADNHADADVFDGFSREMTFNHNTVVASRREDISMWDTAPEINGNVIALHQYGGNGVQKWAELAVPSYVGDHNIYYSDYTETVFTQ